MRTGTSSLKQHTSISDVGGARDVYCDYCRPRRVESNYHFLFECVRYDSARGPFMRAAKVILGDLGVEMTERSLLGFIPEVMRHSLDRGRFRDKVLELYKTICEYMYRSGRFKKK